MAKGKVLAGLVLVGGIFVATQCTTVVPQGHVGAVYDRMEKGIQDYTLSEGFHFTSPFQKVNAFPTSIETKYMSADEREGSEENESISVGTKDGSLNADLSISYRFIAKDVPQVQRDYRGKTGDQIVNEVLRGQFRTWVNDITKKYDTMTVHRTGTSSINSELTKYFNEKGEKYGVTFENVSLAETRVSSEVQKQIDRILQINQETEQKRLELEQAKINQDKEKINQETALIKAQGERKANAEKAQGLDAKILEQMKIEKWDGKLPMVTDGQSIVNLK